MTLKLQIMTGMRSVIAVENRAHELSMPRGDIEKSRVTVTSRLGKTSRPCDGAWNFTKIKHYL